MMMSQVKADTIDVNSDIATQRMSLTLLDMPQLILDDIVQFVRRITFWDGYVIDLRLICSKYYF